VIKIFVCHPFVVAVAARHARIGEKELVVAARTTVGISRVGLMIEYNRAGAASQIQPAWLVLAAVGKK
jgi:hypothetical protein